MFDPHLAEKYWSTTRMFVRHIRKMLIDNKDVTWPHCLKCWSASSVSLDDPIENASRPQGCHFATLTTLLKILVILWKILIDKDGPDHLGETLVNFKDVTQKSLRKYLVDHKDIIRPPLLKMFDHKDVLLVTFAENIGLLQRQQLTLPKMLIDLRYVTQQRCGKYLVGHKESLDRVAENIDRLQGCLSVILLKMLIDFRTSLDRLAEKYCLNTRMLLNHSCWNILATSRLLVSHLTEKCLSTTGMSLDQLAGNIVRQGCHSSLKY